MKKIDGEGIVLPRLRQHRVLLNDILADSRISGNRRILGLFLSIWMDTYQHPELQERFLRLIEQIFGNASRTKWDDAEIPQPANLDAATADATEKLKSIFDEVLNGGDKSEISTAKL